MEQRLLHVEAAVVVHHPVEQFGAVHGVGLHDRGDEIVFGEIEDLHLVAQLLEERREGPRRVHGPVGEVRLPIPGHAVGFFQRFGCLVVEADDELRFGEDVGFAQQADRFLVLRHLGFLVEAVELQLRGRFGAKAHMHEAGLAPHLEIVAVAVDVGDAGVDAPLHLVGQTTGDEFFAEFGELLLVDGGFLVGEDEEADIVVVDQPLDLIDHLLGIAHTIVAPELPLRTEGTGEGAAAGHVRDGDAHAERHVDVLAPGEDVPVRHDAVEILDGGRGLGGDNLRALAVGEALYRSAISGPAAFIDSAHEIDEDFLALAAHDHVDPRRFAQHLLEHEGGMDAAQHAHRLRNGALGDLENVLRLVDGGRDGGDADDIGVCVAEFLFQNLVAQVIGHRIDEGNLVEAGRLQPACEIGRPGGWPVAGDFRTTGVIVRVNEYDMHGFPSP